MTFNIKYQINRDKCFYIILTSSCRLRAALQHARNLQKMKKMNTENGRFPTFSANASNYSVLQCSNPVYYSHRQFEISTDPRSFPSDSYLRMIWKFLVLIMLWYPPVFIPGVGVRLRPLDTSATIRPIAPAPDGDDK
jgi:hypothetical protein